MERGCVEDQPQHLNTPEFRELLRLVEDDTAALRVFKTRSSVYCADRRDNAQGKSNRCG